MQMANEKAQEYFKGFPEAPASVVIFVDVDGANVQLTMRDWDEGTLLSRVSRILQAHPKAVTQNPPGQQRQPARQGNGQPSFVIEGPLSIEIKDGKTYAKVRGGNFTRHGVRIWWEPMAEAGLIQDEMEYEELDPRNPLDLTGWTALYSTKQSDGGRPTPEKVIKLIAP
jgi:hypothetical protein